MFERGVFRVEGNDFCAGEFFSKRGDNIPKAGLGKNNETGRGFYFKGIDVSFRFALWVITGMEPYNQIFPINCFRNSGPSASKDCIVRMFKLLESLWAIKSLSTVPRSIIRE